MIMLREKELQVIFTPKQTKLLVIGCFIYRAIIMSNITLPTIP